MVTDGDIRAALALRFDPPAWALFSEVSNGTGARAERRADAVAMSLWPSRGLELHGVEIKVSRSDWQRELKRPGKSDPVQMYCDRWWIATVKDVVRPGELPPTWGLLLLKGNKLVCETEAPVLTPIPLDKAFLASLLRRAAAGEHKVKGEAYERGREVGRGLGPEEHQAELSRVNSELFALKKQLEEFETKSGVKIDQWSGGYMGEAVKRVLRLRGGDDPLEYLRRVRETLDAHLKGINHEIREHEQAVHELGKIEVRS